MSDIFETTMALLATNLHQKPLEGKLGVGFSGQLEPSG